MKQRFGVFATLVLTGVLASMPEWGWSAVVLRLKIKDKCRWIVPVRLNGRGEYGFLVDTGATTSCRRPRSWQPGWDCNRRGVRFPAPTPERSKVPMACWLENLAVGPRSQVGLDVISVDLREVLRFRMAAFVESSARMFCPASG